MGWPMGYSLECGQRQDVLSCKGGKAALKDTGRVPHTAGKDGAGKRQKLQRQWERPRRAARVCHVVDQLGGVVIK